MRKLGLKNLLAWMVNWFNEYFCRPQWDSFIYTSNCMLHYGYLYSCQISRDCWTAATTRPIRNDNKKLFTFLISSHRIEMNQIPNLFWKSLDYINLVFSASYGSWATQWQLETQATEALTKFLFRRMIVFKSLKTIISHIYIWV